LPYEDLQFTRQATVQYFTDSKLIKTDRLPVTDSGFCKLFFITTQPPPFTPTFEDFQSQVENELQGIVGDQQRALVDLSDLITLILFALIGLGVVFLIFLIVMIIQKRDEKAALDQSTVSINLAMEAFRKVTSGMAILVTHDLSKFDKFVDGIKLQIDAMNYSFRDFMLAVSQPLPSMRKEALPVVEPKVKPEEMITKDTEEGGFIQSENPVKKKEPSLLEKIPHTIADLIKTKKTTNESELTKEQFYLEYSDIKKYNYDGIVKIYEDLLADPDTVSTPWKYAKHEALASVIRDRVHEIAKGDK